MLNKITSIRNAKLTAAIFTVTLGAVFLFSTAAKAATITTGASSVQAGSSLTISGSCQYEGVEYWVYFDSSAASTPTNEIADTKIDQTGKFSFAYAVPADTLAGTYTVTVLCADEDPATTVVDVTVPTSAPPADKTPADTQKTPVQAPQPSYLSYKFSGK